MKQDISGSVVYPIVSIAPPITPDRRYLYSLTPIGIGTGDVESLSSYVSRLALEYYASPSALVTACVEKYTTTPKCLGRLGYNVFASKNVNGFNETTKTVVSAVERATLRSDIIYMTLLPWQAILGINQLRHERAWCGDCFREDLQNGRTVYEKLSWKIRAVKICLTHRQELTTVCPRCQKRQINFSSYSFPGFCSRCKSWLGEKEESSNPKDETPSPKLSEEVWIAEEIGKILSAAGEFKMDVRDRINFADSLTILKDHTPFDNYGTFRKEMGLKGIPIRSLVRCHQDLSFGYMMKISRLFDCSPIDLLLGRKFTLTYKEKGKKAKTKEIDPHRYPRSPPMKGVIKLMLECLKRIPVPSLTEVEKELLYEYSYEALWEISPALCSWYSKIHATGGGFPAEILPTFNRPSELLTEMLEIITTLQNEGLAISEENIRARLKRHYFDTNFWAVVRVAVNELTWNRVLT